MIKILFFFFVDSGKGRGNIKFEYKLEVMELE